MIQIDMKMPTSCEECPLGNKGNIAVGCKLSEYAWAYSWGKGKLPNCPLHEVTDTDTVSRLKGHWINISVSVSGDSTADCSRCGATVHNSFADTINFCPNCGADMRP